MNAPRTLLEAITHFSDLDVATQHFARLRWPDGPTCSRCGCTEYSYLSKRRLWQCKGCRYQYSVKKGTIFEDSAIDFDKWLPAVWLIASCKNGISSHEMARALGVCQKTAWFMLHRIRLAMQTGSFEKFSEKFDGAVEVDETLIGGKARNLKVARRRELAGPDGRVDASVNKTAVMGFRQRDGQVAVTVIDGRKKGELQPEVRRRVKPDATVITDELGSYTGLDAHYQHLVINHAEKYVRPGSHERDRELLGAAQEGPGGDVCVGAALPPVPLPRRAGVSVQPTRGRGRREVRGRAGGIRRQAGDVEATDEQGA